jgi:hypothetical protein
VKKYTIEQRTQFLEEWKKSCMPLKDFASEQNININTFKYWVINTKKDSKVNTAFLPLTIVKQNEVRSNVEPCVIKIGELLSIECTSTSNLQSLEIALQAAVNICGLRSKN